MDYNGLPFFLGFSRLAVGGKKSRAEVSRKQGGNGFTQYAWFGIMVPGFVKAKKIAPFEAGADSCNLENRVKKMGRWQYKLEELSLSFSESFKTFPTLPNW